MQVDDVELFPAQDRLDRIVKGDIECHANHAPVCGDRDGATDAIEAVTDFEAESQMTLMNRYLDSEVETVFLRGLFGDR